MHIVTPYAKIVNFILAAILGHTARKNLVA